MCPVIKFPKTKVLKSKEYNKYRIEALSVSGLLMDLKNINKVKYTNSEIMRILKENNKASELHDTNPKDYRKFSKYIIDNLDLRIKENNIVYKEFYNKLCSLNNKISKCSDQKECNIVFTQFCKNELSNNEANYINQFRRLFLIEYKIIPKLKYANYDRKLKKVINIADKSDMITNTLANIVQILERNSNNNNYEILNLYKMIKDIVTKTYTIPTYRG